jgi:hypothetical protein
MAAKRKKPGGGASSKATAKESGNAPRTTSPVAGATMAGSLMPAVPTGSIAGNMPPAALFSTTLAEMNADASDEIGDLAPTFGDVLLSIGTGVAESQDALDQGVVDTAQTLSDTKITVVTDVIQTLDDDGLPVVEDTQLVTHEVSLINYVTPTVHEWSHVALSMDLSVGEMNRERGVQFSQTQNTGYVGGVGLFWGFLGWFGHSQSETSSYYSANQRMEADWSRGQVRVDAQLRPRDIGQFPTPAQVTIGPQIYFSLGSVSEGTTDGVVTERSVDVILTVRKSNGDENPAVNLVVDSGPFRQSFSTDDGFTGSTTNSDGQCKITLTRDIPSPRFLRSMTATITVSLGDINKTTDITL